MVKEDVEMGDAGAEKKVEMEKEDVEMMLLD